MSTPNSPAVAARVPAAANHFSLSAIAYSPTTRKIVQFMATYDWAIALVGGAAFSLYFGVVAGVVWGSVVALVPQAVLARIKPTLPAEVEAILDRRDRLWDRELDLYDWAIETAPSLEAIKTVISEMHYRGFSPVQMYEIALWWKRKVGSRENVDPLSLIPVGEHIRNRLRDDTREFNTAVVNSESRRLIGDFVMGREKCVPSFFIADWLRSSLISEDVAQAIVATNKMMIPSRALQEENGVWSKDDVQRFRRRAYRA